MGYQRDNPGLIGRWSN